ncbi:coiled-coil domain-containing protein 57 isoform X4 [Takifugu flavidus]|nr:coiled-coil domain-containing protein 57 isoform X4 [Takifugu flavidus]
MNLILNALNINIFLISSVRCINLGTIDYDCSGGILRMMHYCHGNLMQKEGSQIFTKQYISLSLVATNLLSFYTRGRSAMQSGKSLEVQLASKDREWKDLPSAVSQFKKAQDECNFYRQEEHHVQVGDHKHMHIIEKEKGNCKSQYRLHLNKIICCMTDEVHKLTMDYERVKCDLQNKIHELERQLNIQRQEMTAFQKELHDHKHYFNMKVNDLQALLSSQDLKAPQDRKISKHFCDHLQTQLRHKEQHMENISSVKDSKINDLEEKLTMMEMKMKVEEEKYVEKYQDVLKTLKESEVQQEIKCRAQSHHLQKVEKQIVRLQKNMEILHDTLKKKEKTVHWYEQQLSASLEREKNLEIMRTQIELEWQKCCENMKTEHNHMNQQLIKGLIQNKNQCLSPAPDKIYNLQECNAELQGVVSQMRKDMEALLQYQVQSQASLPLESYHGLPAEISTHLSPQSNLHKQGGLWQRQNDNSVSLMPLVCTEKLQQEKQHLRVQHSSHLISGDKLKNVQGHPVPRARLKHAAFCITRLIKEKQHLIEMCNRLRGMKSSSGFKELDLSTELREQHGSLKNLEQHQSQITSKCRGSASHLTEQEEATAKEVAANPPSQETEGPEVSRNPLTQSDFRQTQSSVYVDQNLYQSIESLQSLWDLLDCGLSSSTLSEEGELKRTDTTESGAAADQMM